MAPSAGPNRAGRRAQEKGIGERPQLVVEDDELASIVEELCHQGQYAIDTEFHRERTYFPKVALVQLAWADGAAIIDPLHVDIGALSRLMDSPAVAVMHAGAQDLEVLQRECGRLPRVIFDTQIAAGFLGMSNPSLAALHERELDKVLPKGPRMTDWLRRPLSDQQLEYAHADVADLLEIAQRLTKRLGEKGRLQWAEAECALLLERAQRVREPADAWLRIKEIRQLRGASLAVGQAVAEWRERRAAEIDEPARFVLSDLAVVGIAQKKPRSIEALRRVRGVDDRHLRRGVGEQVLEAVAAGSAAEPRRSPTPPRRDLDASLRPAVTLVGAWLGQMARNNELDPSLVGTRADIEALLRGDSDARLAHGWREELVGGPIRSLLAGESALAFDGEGGVVLEPRARG